jgi:hypothetical protein
MEAVMNFMSRQREGVILENPEDPRIIRRETPWNMVREGTPWSRIVAVLRNTDLAVVVALCAIGLLATVALLIAFPNFGEIAQSIQQF